MRIVSLVSASLAVALIALPAVAQNAGLPANSATLSRSAGFTPDPIVINVVAGGSVDANRSIGGSCVGNISDAPDVEFTYSAGSWPLAFGVVSDGDTTLVINGPDGRWFCADDVEGLNPVVVFQNPGSGVYDIWVGHLSGSAGGQLLITETP